MEEIKNFLSSLTEEDLANNEIKSISLIKEKSKNDEEYPAWLIIKMINGYETILKTEESIIEFIEKFKK